MVRRIYFSFAVLAPLSLLALTQLSPLAWWGFLFVGPIVLIGLHDVVQRKRALLRIYPVIGHGRYLMEEIRPEIQQYFVESNTDGTPFNRERRSVVYQRAKRTKDALPFGTQLQVNDVGYEWIGHSMQPRHIDPEHPPRVSIGAHTCDRPYSSSYLNISAMSFGSLSKTAITALNLGAEAGAFAHNTGEGGISDYHLQGGDLIWQLGTGYFGARSLEGGFSPEAFAEKSALPEVKMIEIKLSQGAKPGHGGILPGEKVSPEIARIRGVPVGKTVLSPPAHTAFGSPRELLEFVAELRELSGGKPVGFKLCVGHPSDFYGICKAMLETDLIPDFITVDGGEGGTGAAPLEFSNHVGMPLRQGLHFVHRSLVGLGLRDRTKLIASGKIATGFDLIRALALGADLCASARAMMFALGCIQARACHTNHCPVGIATQETSRANALHIPSRSARVTAYHEETVASFLDLVGTAGLDSPRHVHPGLLLKRISQTQALSYDELFPLPDPGAWRSDESLIANRRAWERASAEHFDSIARAN